MVGKRQFDEEAVLDAITDAFWAGGWRATSMDRLASATRVHKHSLQNAFGDKEALFLLALERYRSRLTAAMAARGGADTPRGTVESYLGIVLERTRTDGAPIGCLTTFGCMKLDGLPPKAAAAVRGQIRRAIGTLDDAFRRHRDAGRLGAATDCEGLATFVVGIARGMAVLQKAGLDEGAVRALLDHSLAAVAACEAPRRTDRTRRSRGTRDEASD